MSKTESKPAKDAKASTSSEKTASESTSSDKSGADAGGTSDTTGTSSGGGGGGGRPISYFSSVSTPAYRDGWSAIFAKSDGAKSAKRKAAPKRATKPLPEIALAFDELPADLQEALAAEVRSRLGRRKGQYDKARDRGTLRWSLTCRLD